MATANNERKRLALLYIETKYPHIMEERFALAEKISTLDFKMEELEEHIDAIVARDFFVKPQIKDSGARYVNEKGGQRDLSEGKPNFKYVPFGIIKLMYQMKKGVLNEFPILVIEELCLDITVNKETDVNTLRDIIYSMLMIIGEGNVYDGLKQFALFMERCAKKYSYNNWVLLDTEEDFERFTISIGRHATQALFEQTDEFHREAVVFNAMCLLLNFEREEESE